LKEAGVTVPVVKYVPYETVATATSSETGKPTKRRKVDSNTQGSLSASSSVASLHGGEKGKTAEEIALEEPVQNADTLKPELWVCSRSLAFNA
jgi:hypothetical protein